MGGVYIRKHQESEVVREMKVLPVDKNAGSANNVTHRPNRPAAPGAIELVAKALIPMLISIKRFFLGAQLDPS